MTSFNTRRAARSGNPVIRATSPRSNSPRISVSSSSRGASGFQRGASLDMIPQAFGKRIDLEQPRHECHLVEAGPEKPQNEFIEGAKRKLPPPVEIALPRRVGIVEHKEGDDLGDEGDLQPGKSRE